MAQVPATPKLRRALTLARAWLRLHPAHHSSLSEYAALTLRHVHDLEHWRAPDHVSFVLPLVGPAHVSDWGRVTDLLSQTLSSLQAQTNPNWHAVICCQVAPPLPDDPRITFLPFTEAVEGNDKWRKLAVLYDHLRQSETRPGLAMTFDADDRAAPTLVDHLLARPGGALLCHGYVFDVGHDRLALAAPQSLRQPGAKAFWKLCGSCAALPFDPAQASAEVQWDFLRAMSQHEHRMIPYLARLAGSPLSPIEAPVVLYLLNHGENFGARRGRVSFKTRFAERFEIRDRAVQDMVRKMYGLERVRSDNGHEG